MDEYDIGKDGKEVKSKWGKKNDSKKGKLGKDGKKLMPFGDSLKSKKKEGNKNDGSKDNGHGSKIDEILESKI